MTTIERVLTLKQIDLLEAAGPRHLLGLADLVREVEMWVGQTIYGEADLAVRGQPASLIGQMHQISGGKDQGGDAADA